MSRYLGKKLHEFLKTEQRNWRETVFHLDGDDLRNLTVNKDYSPEGRITNIRNAQMITEYLHNQGCDVVVSLVAPSSQSPLNLLTTYLSPSSMAVSAM